MPSKSLESRVDILERELAALKAQSGRVKDWRRTIGIFTDSSDAQDAFAEAMKLRAADRRKARHSPKNGSANP